MGCPRRIIPSSKRPSSWLAAPPLLPVHRGVRPASGSGKDGPLFAGAGGADGLGGAANMRRFWLTLAFACALAGCRQDMANQPKFKPLAENNFFPDGRRRARCRPIPSRAANCARTRCFSPAAVPMANSRPFFRSRSRNQPWNAVESATIYTVPSATGAQARAAG